MKQTLLILVMALTLALPSWSLKKEDIMFRNGVERTHRTYDYHESYNLVGKYDATCWIISAMDSLIYADTKSFEGLLRNNFDQYYHDTEIGKMSNLHRQTPENIGLYTKCKDDMAKIRAEVLADTIHALGEHSTEWFVGYEYDMDTKSFSFQFDDRTFRLPTKMDSLEDFKPLKYMYITTLQIPEKVAEKFNKHKPRLNSSGQEERPEMLYDYKLPVKIENLNVALAVDDVKTKITSGKPRDFSFYYQYRFVEDEKYPHLEVTDIILLYNPTQEVVWTAMTGDHSNEVHLQN
ncbi:hypothetical protein [Duncaniella muris]|uniref:hypothetical protein n=1 Tax=Duncaniella muris TaxID=2094150 RepID=UPI00263AEBF3|nr:hypothetical protein [Duncaniella muris]